MKVLRDHPIDLVGRRAEAWVSVIGVVDLVERVDDSELHDATKAARCLAEREAVQERAVDIIGCHEVSRGVTHCTGFDRNGYDRTDRAEPCQFGIIQWVAPRELECGEQLLIHSRDLQALHCLDHDFPLGVPACRFTCTTSVDYCTIIP